MIRTLYQTVEDRDNPDDIELNGPYICKNNKAWFGHGYYFWDSFICLAHWWGNLCYQKNGYIICQSSLSEDNMCRVYDLVGHPELLLEIEAASEIITKGTGKKDKLHIPEIIEYLKRKTSFLKKYGAIRAYPLKTLPDKMAKEYQIKFNDWNRAYIDLRPAIQFCFFDKSLLNEDYHIVYPESYCNEMVM